MISGTLQLLPTPCNKKIKSSDFSVYYQISEKEIILNYHMERQLYEQFQNSKITTKQDTYLFKREDKLWEKSCLEFFLKADSQDPCYIEFNFSLNGKWNAFNFDDYRVGKKEDTELSIKQFEPTHLKSFDKMVVSINLTHKLGLKLNSPRFHGSSILYMDKSPCYFHSLPESQSPPAFQYYHNH